LPATGWTGISERKTVGSVRRSGVLWIAGESKVSLLKTDIRISGVPLGSRGGWNRTRKKGGHPRDELCQSWLKEISQGAVTVSRGRTICSESCVIGKMSEKRNELKNCWTSGGCGY